MFKSLIILINNNNKNCWFSLDVHACYSVLHFKGRKQKKDHTTKIEHNRDCIFIKEKLTESKINGRPPSFNIWFRRFSNISPKILVVYVTEPNCMLWQKENFMKEISLLVYLGL